MGGWRDRDGACGLRPESVRQGQVAGGGAQSTWSAALFNHAATSVCSSKSLLRLGVAGEGCWKVGKICRMNGGVQVDGAGRPAAGR
jgi:hypothetical protein